MGAKEYQCKDSKKKNRHLGGARMLTLKVLMTALAQNLRQFFSNHTETIQNLVSIFVSSF